MLARSRSNTARPLTTGGRDGEESVRMPSGGPVQPAKVICARMAPNSSGAAVRQMVRCEVFILLTFHLADCQVIAGLTTATMAMRYQEVADDHLASVYDRLSDAIAAGVAN